MPYKGYKEGKYYHLRKDYFEENAFIKIISSPSKAGFVWVKVFRFVPAYHTYKTLWWLGGRSTRNRICKELSKEEVLTRLL